MLNEVKIKYFLTLAAELNYRKASEKLFITQQALSAQISSMESDIGGPLFSRTTRQVSLTPLGCAMRDLFVKTIKEYNQIQADYIAPKHPQLRIGCLEDMDMGATLFEARSRLPERYRDLQLSFYFHPRVQYVIQALIDHSIDLALYPEGAKVPADIKVQPLIREHPYAFLSSSYPGAFQGMQLSDLKQAMFFMGSEATPARKEITDYCHANGVEVSFSQSGDNPSVERLLVESGAGVGLGNRYSLMYRNPNLIQIPMNILCGNDAAWRKNTPGDLIPAFVQELAAIMHEQSV